MLTPKKNNLILLLVFGCFYGAATAQFPGFEARVVDPAIDKVCYGLTTADVNGDGKLDLVGVSNRAVYWYENPGWNRHTIIADQTLKDNVCIAPYDIDGDGQVDFALGAGWTKTGSIQWLQRGESLEQPWSVHRIDLIPWTHRMRFADVLGTGRAQLVVSPLNRTVGDGVQLTAFEIPKNPVEDRWKKTVIHEKFNRMHNHWHLDFDRNGTIDTVTASQEGIHWIRKKGNDFETSQLSAHAAGEIKFGRMGDSRMFATIEPMHGNQAVAYVQSGKRWQRTVLDDQLKQGHAVWLANLDNDAEDEIVIGHREPGNGKVKGPGLYVFDYTPKSRTWNKIIVDNGGCAVEDALAADFDGDGRMDLAAGGRATHNVKIYFNRGVSQ